METSGWLLLSLVEEANVAEHGSAMIGDPYLR